MAKHKLHRKHNSMGRHGITKTKTSNNEQQCEDNEDSTNVVVQWIESIAVLGDSVYSLATATIVLLLSIWISYRANSDDNDNYRIPFTSRNNRSSPQTSEKENTGADKYKALGAIPKIDPPYIFSVKLDEKGDIQFNDMDTFDKIHTAFYTDGVIAIRGLLSDELLQQLDDESMTVVQDSIQQQPNDSIVLTEINSNDYTIKSSKQHKKKQLQFFTVKHRILFQNKNNQTLSAFAKVAVRSAIPTMVASLHYNMTQQQMMKINTATTTPSTNVNVSKDAQQSKHNTNDNLRVLRDIFLAKDNGQFICGWHVDDMGFWPATQDSPTGINVWVAIDDMPPSDGGGFAVAVQSHVASWRNEAHTATGSSLYFPLPDGYNNASHMILNRTGGGTCNIQQVAPHLHQRMEETSRVYDIRRGDIIIHTRWLFHRTIPFKDSDDTNSRIYRRYSIRYGPGSSKIPPGYGIEYSVLWNETNGGKSADDVCRLDNGTPWYPIAWGKNSMVENGNTSSGNISTNSVANDNIDNNKEELYLANQFTDLVTTRFPIVEQLAQQRQTEMQRLLAKQQRYKVD
jgi:Phytanoyl-CoA dioxygenase (PhyH)